MNDGTGSPAPHAVSLKGPRTDISVFENTMIERVGLPLGPG